MSAESESESRGELSARYAEWAEGLFLAGELEAAEQKADRALEIAVALRARKNEAVALLVKGRIAAERVPQRRYAEIRGPRHSKDG